MGVNNVNRGADTRPNPAEDPQFQQQVEALEQKRAELLKYMEENSEWLSQEQRDSLSLIVQKIDGIEVAMEGAIELGRHPLDSLGERPQSHIIDPRELEKIGWNGNVDINADMADPQVQGDPGKYGEYMGTVSAERSHTEDDLLAFKIDDKTEKVILASRGKDILITTIERDTGEKRTWVWRNGSVNGMPLILSAHETTKGVTIDASRVYRISDGSTNETFGNVTGLQIWGGTGDDTIIGSQGDDGIVGGLGKDKIFGMAGNDTIYGDLKGENSEGDNDFISGGVGNDVIVGGGGAWDQVTVSDEQDGNGAFIREVEETVNDSSVNSIPINFNDQANGFLQSADWEADGTPQENGMVVISNTTGKGGTIEIDMNLMADRGQTYDKVFASRGPNNSLILTFVGEDHEGNPVQFSVKIKDFFNFMGNGTSEESVITLNIKGPANLPAIIDFGALRGNLALGQNAKSMPVINIEGGGGDDVIIGPHNALLNDGVDLDDLLGVDARGVAQSQGMDDLDLEQVKSGLLTDPDKTKFKLTVDGTEDKINVGPGREEDSAGNMVDKTIGPDDTLNIRMPAGYEKAYLMNAENGGYYLVLVKPGETAKTIVIHIGADIVRAWGDKVNVNLTTHGNGDTAGTAVRPVYLSRDALTDGYKIDGGAGADLIYGQKGQNITANDPDDSVHESRTHPDDEE